MISFPDTVALLVSAWIEIRVMDLYQLGNSVALLVSAWIEIGNPHISANDRSRTPRECVD